MINQPLVKRRKIETVFLGTIEQIIDNATTKNNLIELQTEEDKNLQTENDNNYCEVGTSLNQSNNTTYLKSNTLTGESDHKCSLNDSNGDHSMDSDFFATFKPKTVVNLF